MDFDTSIFTKHPIVTVGVFLVGAFVFYEIALAPGGSTGGAVVSAPASGATDNTSSELAASVNMAQLQASLTAQSNKIQADANAQAASIAGSEYLAKLQSDTAVTINTQNVGLTQTVDLAQLTTQTAINDSNNAAQGVRDATAAQLQKDLTVANASLQTTLADIQSKTVLGLGAQNADVTTTLAKYGAAVSVAGIQGSRDVAVAQASASKHNSDNNLLATGISLLAAFF